MQMTCSPITLVMPSTRMMWHMMYWRKIMIFFVQSQYRLSVLWNSVYLFKTKMLSSVFLRSFESLQEGTPDEAGAKTGIPPNPKISALCAPIPGRFLSWVHIYSCQTMTALQGYLHALKVSVHRHASTFRTSFRFKRVLSWMTEEPCQAKIFMSYKKCTTPHVVWNINNPFLLPRHQKLNHY